MDFSCLPQEIREYIPSGYALDESIWLVLPMNDGTDKSILALNKFMKCQDWHPDFIRTIIWFGDGGMLGLAGWHPEIKKAVLWSPIDWDEFLYAGSVSELWQHLRDNREHAT